MSRFPYTSIALLAVGLVACPLTIEVREDPSAPRDGGGQGTFPQQDAGTGGGDGGCAGVRQIGEACHSDCDCATPGAHCYLTCRLRCQSDFECPEGHRCDYTYSECVPGPRLGEYCEDSFDCNGFAHCDPVFEWCYQKCSSDSSCPAGYRCAPDGFCIERCDRTAWIGETCENSMNCGCGFCVQDATDTLRCHQRCTLDRDCPGGALGSCEERPGGTRACKL